MRPVHQENARPLLPHQELHNAIGDHLPARRYVQDICPALRVAQRLLARAGIENERVRSGPIGQRLQRLAIGDDRDQPYAGGLELIKRRSRLIRRDSLGGQLIVHASERAGRAVVLVAERRTGKTEIGGSKVQPRDRRQFRKIYAQNGGLDLLGRRALRRDQGSAKDGKRKPRNRHRRNDLPILLTHLKVESSSEVYGAKPILMDRGMTVAVCLGWSACSEF